MLGPSKCNFRLGDAAMLYLQSLLLAVLAYREFGAVGIGAYAITVAIGWPLNTMARRAEARKAGNE